MVRIPNVSDSASWTESWLGPTLILSAYRGWAPI